MLAASTALPFLLVLALVPLEIAEGEAVRSTPPAAITIACVGDSITFGVCSSSPSHSYPGQLQLLLDAAHGTGTYAVSNLGSSGATMLKHGDQPYWDRGEFGKLTAAGKHWDVVLIMLGTNDAKDSGDAGNHSWHGNWQHDCGGPTHTTTHGCAFAEDYASMIGIVNSTKIYALVPPPIFGATPASQIGANQTVINSVFPKLVPMIAKQNNVGLIDMFKGMGGVNDWHTKFPGDCSPTNWNRWAPCQYWCDKQSCDQCHLDDYGYHHFATVVQAGLGL